jgi:SAM-dependent methyltransferase
VAARRRSAKNQIMDTETTPPPPAAAALHPHIDDYYGSRFNEAGRLSVNALGRLERDRTQELLLRFLPPAPARVLDVGGGPGVYAAWLASLGYDVHLIDPVARHVEQAAEHGTFVTERGDARDLAQPDASADVVLLLGPLYHLVDAADRARALREARRIARPGGLIAAAFISRQAPITDVAAQLLANDDRIYQILSTLAHRGENEYESGFTVAYFHTLDEIRADFAAAQLGEPSLFGIEGPLLPLLASRLVDDRPEYLEAAVRAARLADDHPALIPSSAHILAVTHAA